MAHYFQWNQATYGIDVPEMDEQHRTLISHMNRLHELHVSRAPRANVAAALETLVRYTCKHFADEEAYMAEIGYPGLATHARVHLDLINKVSTYVRAFRKGGELSSEFFDFLTFWLKSHIRGVDAKYARSVAVA